MAGLLVCLLTARHALATGRSSTRRAAHGGIGHRHARRQAPLRDHDRRSQISNSSSSSSLTTSTAQPASRSAAARRGSAPPRRRRRPRSAARRAAASARVDLAADDELLQVAAGQALRRRVRPAGLDVEAAISASAMRDHVADADPAAGADRIAPRQQVFCASDSVGTAPRPRRSSGTKCRPSPRSARAMRRDVAIEERDTAGAERGSSPETPTSAPAGRCRTRRRCRRSRRRARRRRRPSRSCRKDPCAARQVAHPQHHRARPWPRADAAAAAARRRSSGATGWRSSPSWDRPRP
jgi:hypothetical protein